MRPCVPVIHHGRRRGGAQAPCPRTQKFVANPRACAPPDAGGSIPNRHTGPLGVRGPWRAPWRIRHSGHTLMPAPGKAPEGRGGRLDPERAALAAHGDPGRDPGGDVAADGWARGCVGAAERRPVTDVAAWLRGIGLDQYEAAFRDNGVDGSVLPELTAEDLKEMGVAAVGHRRKLLAAIAALRGTTSAARGAGPRRCLRGAARRCRSQPGRGRARRGAAAADGAVLRPRGLDRALGPPRPRGPARGDRRLPPRGRRGGAATGRPRRQVPGRRRARLLRLAAGARGRRRARRARRPRRGEAVAGLGPGRAARGARRHRHRSRGGGRGHRRGRGARAGRGGRDAEPRRPAAGAGRARGGGAGRGDAPPRGRAVRVGRLGRPS